MKKGGLTKYFLPATVFLTGAAALIIEVVGIRVLSPYFGNTMFTVSSVISVFLAALAFGYYFGGSLADKHPSLRLYFSIIFLSGIGILVSQLLSFISLPAVSLRFSLMSGPFISSIIIFLIPGFLLGMISPFAITLQKKIIPQNGVGKVSGEIFFFSTFGSILGSLLTGFILIPAFGIDRIVSGTGLFLIILGFIPLILLHTGIRSLLLFIISILVILDLLFPLLFYLKAASVLYSRDGIYEKITIADQKYEGKNARFFYLDRSVSAAMFLGSDELLLPYTKYYALYKLINPDLRKALIIGGGIYTVPKALLKDVSNILIDVVEIEPSLPGLSQQYFNLPDDKRLVSHIEDGRRFLKTSKTNYDYIFSDVYYSYYSVPAHFTTVEFFRIAKQKLTENGIFIANFIGSLERNKPSLLFSAVKTFREVFPDSYFFAVQSLLSPDNQNIIFLGLKNSRSIDWQDPAIRKHEDPFLKSVPDHLIDMNRFPLSLHPVLTDNYAPVDYLTSKLFEYR